jgi:GTPase
MEVLSSKGYTALVGLPNSGKSTLINRLLERKVGIISHRPHTTRVNVLGILKTTEMDITLLDTPGLLGKHCRRPGDRGIHNQIQNALYNDALECCLFLVDASGNNHAADLEYLHKVHEEHPQTVFWVVFNKIDIVPKERLLKLADTFSHATYVQHFFMVSGKKGHGLDDLKKALVNYFSKSSKVFHGLVPKELPIPLMAAEFTREKIFQFLRDELPYKAHVVPERLGKLSKNGEKSLVIHQIIFVERPAHKQIVLGKNGAQIKRIREIAAQTMGAYFNKKIHLFLHVKVHPHWDEAMDEVS